MFYLTLGYFLRTPDNSNLFSISLEGSSYSESTVQDIFKRRVNSNPPQTGNCDLYGQRSLLQLFPTVFSISRKRPRQQTEKAAFLRVFVIINTLVGIV